MKNVLLSMIMAIALAGVAKPQGTSESMFEQAKNEVLRIEKDKVPILVRGGTEAADWFDRYDADNMTFAGPDGGVLTKAQIVEEWRSGKRKAFTLNEYGYHVNVYGDGATAVVTLLGKGTHKGKDGKATAHRDMQMDVWVKKGGNWQRVAHSVTPLSTP